MASSIATLVSSAIVSPRLRQFRRDLDAWRRKLGGGRANLLYFHQADDPYSALTAQLLPRLAASYDITITPYLVPPPDTAAAPDAERLQRFSREDAARLSQAHGLEFPGSPRTPAAAPAPRDIKAAETLLAAAIQDGSFITRAAAISAQLWAGESLSAAGDATAALAEGAQRRQALGHYLGGTFYFESEWFWGVDRLPYLEERLSGLRKAGAGAVVTQLAEPRYAPLGVAAQIEFFPSLRSPYTYLAAKRVRLLAARHGAQLVLRPVLPMVMRGLPVPQAKRIYIVRDTKREAERLGMPFGRIADPVGLPTERGLAVLFKVMQHGDGSAFLESFLAGVFAEAIDAGSDAGLRQIAARAGVDDAMVAAGLADDTWRAQAEANRQAMLELGLWGVPSFHVTGCPAVWGQDRLWAVEDALHGIAQARQLPADDA